MTWSAQHARDSRRVTSEILDLVEQGVIDRDNLIRDLLGWMSESDVAEFARRNDYITDEEAEDE
jgi:DNA-binding ferritin-like protein (Dps family)